jgi:hypothetical protein
MPKFRSDINKGGNTFTFEDVRVIWQDQAAVCVVTTTKVTSLACVSLNRSKRRLSRRW